MDSFDKNIDSKYHSALKILKTDGYSSMHKKKLSATIKQNLQNDHSATLKFKLNDNEKSVRHHQPA